MPGRPHPAVLLALLLLVSTVAAAPAVHAAPPDRAPTAPPDRASAPRYRPPVAATVTDPFRPPGSPYGPGNRGLEYATRAGQPVGAIGPGTVVFAGTIARRRYVTVLHRDGLRSSYSYLAAIEVELGDAVVAGQRLGVAGERLHLGMRRGDRYLDPATLFRRGRPRLVR